jgi:hypothetical protein
MLSTAATAVASIGPAAHEAIPALKECLGLDAKDEELVRLLKEEAARALTVING